MNIFINSNAYTPSISICSGHNISFVRWRLQSCKLYGVEQINVIYLVYAWYMYDIDGSKPMQNDQVYFFSDIF